MNQIRLLLGLEGVSFLIASLIHSGRLVQGYEHPRARVAEAIIGIVLLAGLVMTLISPQRFRTIGLWTQGFALAGTLIGAFTILVGVGPRTPPDLAYHIVILLILFWGLRFTARAR